jgi:hypothetical protein
MGGPASTRERSSLVALRAELARSPKSGARSRPQERSSLVALRAELARGPKSGARAWPESGARSRPKERSSGVALRAELARGPRAELALGPRAELARSPSTELATGPASLPVHRTTNRLMPATSPRSNCALPGCQIGAPIGRQSFVRLLPASSARAANRRPPLGPRIGPSHWALALACAP